MWTSRKLQDFPTDAKIITSTWFMKKKSNGTYQASINARGYDQAEGMHYNAANIVLSVTNYMCICIFMVVTLMAGHIAKILDMKGAFLHGEFDEVEETMYMAVPEGFELIHQSNMVLVMLKTIYELKNVAREFLERSVERIYCDGL